jgi:hypothetical protein
VYIEVTPCNVHRLAPSCTLSNIQLSTDLLDLYARCISSSQQPEEIISTKEDCDRTHSKFSTFHPAICRETRNSFMNILMESGFALITYLYIALFYWLCCTVEKVAESVLKVSQYDGSW